MASKAWFKPSALPQLVARFEPPSPSQHAKRRAVEVWTTSCIVTNFGMNCNGADESARGDETDHLPRCSTLVNPANPNLTGPHTFPYFPRGGPQPKAQPNRHAHHIMGFVSQWGGMDSGSGMMFSAETIDGLVHQLGGVGLRAECSLVPTHEFSRAYINQQDTTLDLNGDDAKKMAKCPVGAAVMTSPGGDNLRKHYDCIVHTTPPFYNHPPLESEELQKVLGIERGVSDLHWWSRELLRSCYRQSFGVAFACRQQMLEDRQNSLVHRAMHLVGINGNPAERMANRRVAVPLLGAGCRAFPKDVALDAAALESTAWLADDGQQLARGTSLDNNESAIAFGLLERAEAESLAANIDRLMQDMT
ncbi:hypothetical protein ACHAXT_011843 [Thalassiosira profunda]